MNDIFLPEPMKSLLGNIEKKALINFYGAPGLDGQDRKALQDMAALLSEPAQHIRESTGQTRLNLNGHRLRIMATIHPMSMMSIMSRQFLMMSPPKATIAGTGTIMALTLGFLKVIHIMNS